MKNAKWGPGPWDDEPDQADWVDDATGLRCHARRRGSLGHWCGYVDVSKGHTAYGRIVNADVHGDITLAELADSGDWRFGFDCAHLWDFVPGMGEEFRDVTAKYRTLDYVKLQCAHLAKQLKEME